MSGRKANTDTTHRSVTRTRRGLELLGMWCVLFACVAIGMLPVLAPPTPSAGDPADFSVERAVDHVSFIASEPHAMGTPEIGRVRDYLVATLADAGLEPEVQTVDAPDYFRVAAGPVEVSNVLARIPGSGGGAAVLLMAHYDTVPETPGANDNAAAVAALVEVGRVLAAETPPNDVILLFTDGEEPNPRYGASAFAAEHPWFSDVFMVANFEGIGAAGPSVLFQLNGPATDLVGRLVAAVPDPAVFSFMTATTEIIGGAISDFDVFHEAGVPGYNFAFMRGPSIYHTADDNVASLNVAGLAHHGSLALGIARGIGPDEPSDPGSGDGAFFTTGLRWVTRYGSTVAVAAALAAAALLGASLWLRVASGQSSWRALLKGLGLALLATLASVTATTIAWMVIVNLGGQQGLAEGYGYLVMLLAVLAGAGVLVYRRAARTGSDVAGGFAVVWLMLAVLLGGWLPAIGYLFVWPAIAAALAALPAPYLRGYGARLALLGVVALPTAALVTPAVDTFFQVVSPRPGNPGSELPAMVAVPMLLAFLAFGLVAARMRETT